MARNVDFELRKGREKLEGSPSSSFFRFSTSLTTPIIRKREREREIRLNIKRDWGERRESCSVVEINVRIFIDDLEQRIAVAVSAVVAADDDSFVWCCCCFFVVVLLLLAIYIISHITSNHLWLQVTCKGETRWSYKSNRLFSLSEGCFIILLCLLYSIAIVFFYSFL